MGVGGGETPLKTLTQPWLFESVWPATVVPSIAVALMAAPSVGSTQAVDAPKLCSLVVFHLRQSRRASL